MISNDGHEGRECLGCDDYGPCSNWRATIFDKGQPAHVDGIIMLTLGLVMLGAMLWVHYAQ